LCVLPYGRLVRRTERSFGPLLCAREDGVTILDSYAFSDSSLQLCYTLGHWGFPALCPAHGL